MDKKILTIAALVVVFAMGFLYLNQGYLAANDKEDNSCTNKSSCENKSACDDKNREIKAGGEWNHYEFTTDKACCDEMKSELQNSLTSIPGVKEVSFSNTNAAKMTHVTVLYSAGETSEETLAKFVSENKFDCAGKECESKGCMKDGVKSGNMNEGGCDGKKECTPKTEKKSSDSKKL